MADSKKTASESEAVVEATPVEAVVENHDDKVVGEGENLYFFPDIQKSVVAKSYEEAVGQVQADLDAFKSEDNK